MHMKIFVSAAILCLATVNGVAQDPLKSLPDAYKLDFENEWVKVVRVHYAPNQKLPAHEHTQMASAYIYLNDGGPVIFKHIGLAYGAVTRPATKAGSFRLYQAIKEIHEVENTSDLPSEFLRVEFKTDPVNEKSLRGRFYREAYPPGQNVGKVQFENEQVRITRLVCAQRKMIDISTGSNEPSLLIALSPANLKSAPGKGGSSEFKLGLGETRWIAVNKQEQFENVGDGPAEVLRIDFKTKPLSK